MITFLYVASVDSTEGAHLVLRPQFSLEDYNYVRQTITWMDESGRGGPLQSSKD